MGAPFGKPSLTIAGLAAKPRFERFGRLFFPGTMVRSRSQLVSRPREYWLSRESGAEALPSESRGFKSEGGKIQGSHMTVNLNINL